MEPIYMAGPSITEPEIAVVTTRCVLAGTKKPYWYVETFQKRVRWLTTPEVRDHDAELHHVIHCFLLPWESATETR